MKRYIAFTIVILCFSAIAFSQQTRNAGSSTTKDITITTFAGKSGGAETFTWSGSGAIKDSGAWSDNKVIWGAVKSPVVGTLHNTLTLTGSGGTMKLNYNGVLSTTPDPNVYKIEGSWTIVSGTGKYKSMMGQGNGTVMINFSQSTANGTLTGKVH